MTRHAAWGTAAVVILTAVDLLAGGYAVLAAALVLAPLGVALVGSVRDTLVVAAAAVVGAGIGLFAASGLSSRWLVALVVVVLGGTFAVVLALLRHRAEAQADRERALVAVERRLTSALDALGEAVTVMAPDGQMTYANDAAVDLLRAGSRDELLAAAPGEVMARFGVYDEEGRSLDRRALPGYRLLAGETEAPPLLVRNVVRATGEERWLRNTATLVPGDGARPDSVVNVIEDLTPIKRAELRERLLSDATRELGRSLDFGQTLQRVAEVAVPALADWCAVSLPGPDDAIEEVAVAHRDPDKVRLGHRLIARRPGRIGDATARAAVLRGESGTSLVEVPEGALEAYAGDQEHLEMLRDARIASILTVPLDAGGRRLGAMTLVRSDRERRFLPEDVVLAEELAGRAATAVLNATLYTQHAELSATLQRGMLPPPMPAIPGWATATLYHPAGELAEVGGDFFDAFPAGEDWIVAIGDVAGHGPEAAALTALARYTLRTAAELTGDPVRAIAQLDAALRSRGEMSLCTAVCLRLQLASDGRPATVGIASAGHPLPILLRDGTAIPVGEAGPLAGAFPGGVWPLREEVMRPGDALVLFTDGVIDALSRRGRLDETRLQDCLRAGPTDARGLIEHLEAALAVEPGRRRDDTAAVALEHRGEPAEAATVNGSAAASGTA